jgi:hypothetical protein
MNQHQWLIFLPAALLVAASPGAGNFLALTHGLRGGWGVAVLALLGRFTAFAIMILLVMLGVGALLAASAVAFSILKWAGVARAAPVAIGLPAGRGVGGGCARLMATVDAAGVHRCRDESKGHAAVHSLPAAIPGLGTAHGGAVRDARRRLHPDRIRRRERLRAGGQPHQGASPQPPRRAACQPDHWGHHVGGRWLARHDAAGRPSTKSAVGGLTGGPATR